MKIDIKTLKQTNHYYLRYIANIELRKIRTYIKGRENKDDLLNLQDKVLILKLHELFDGYSEEKIGLDEFLGISDAEEQDYLKQSVELFSPYFISKNQIKSLKKAVEKVEILKKREYYNFSEALRKDKVKEGLRRILWHIVSTDNDIFSILIGKKCRSESLYYFSQICDFKDLLTFVGISKEEANQEINLAFQMLSSKLKKRKVKLSTLDEEHKKLQEELAEYYRLVELYCG